MCVCVPNFKFGTLVNQPSIMSLFMQQQNCYHGDEYCCQKYWPLSDRVYCPDTPIDISLQRKRAVALKYIGIYMHTSLDELSDRKGNAEKVPGRARCGGQVPTSTLLQWRLYKLWVC